MKVGRPDPVPLGVASAVASGSTKKEEFTFNGDGVVVLPQSLADPGALDRGAVHREPGVERVRELAAAEARHRRGHADQLVARQSGLRCARTGRGGGTGSSGEDAGRRQKTFGWENADRQRWRAARAMSRSSARRSSIGGHPEQDAYQSEIQVWSLGVDPGLTWREDGPLEIHQVARQELPIVTNRQDVDAVTLDIHAIDDPVRTNEQLAHVDACVLGHLAANIRQISEVP